MAHAAYPKRLYFVGKPAMRVFSAEEEAAVIAAHECPQTPDGDAEKAAIREKLVALGAPAPHHKTGLDKLRVLLADAEALAAAAVDPEPAAE